MCTVIIHVPDEPHAAVRLLAIRDEDPERPWNALGHWWPEHPSVLGVHDVRAGGAWLAADADTHRLAVLLNRAGGDDLPDSAVVSRGTLPLDSVLGHSPEERPKMRGFNLLEAIPGSARVISWDGERRSTTTVSPGTHMIAHDDLDDPATARISHWLEHFRLAEPSDDDDLWYRPWLDILARSTQLGPVDERAIIRDNRPLGYPTLSLLVCAATVRPDGIDVRYGELPAPGTWGEFSLSAGS